MTNHGDDCYFFYYSNCAKGDSCPFRHCEAAMGSEVVCSLWQESRCFRQVCKFRHMEIKKNRKEIACYWENQPAGCQKPHCAFHHEKPRFIDGQYVPPNKSSALKEEEESHEDSLPPVPIPSPANPQLRGVIKAETQENVPSPTHPPVVINPADDEDEDEDDQLSEGEDSRSGSDGSRVVSPRKMAVGSSSDDSLDFGVRTLEEIRLRKALKASMRRAGYPVPSQGSDQRNNGASGEKENMRSFIRPSLVTAKDDTVVFGEETGRRNVADRLGKRVVKEVPAGGDLPMKRCLAERLGRKMDEGEMDLPPQKAERNSESTAPEVIRIKTLEEIRQEKLAKSQGQAPGDNPLPSTPDTTSTTKAPKRGTTGKPAASLHVKTFSEILHAKRKLEEDQQQGPSLRKAKQAAMEAAPGYSQAQGPTETAMPSRVAPPGGGVKVKTLEEIRREKAAKMQARGQEASNGKSPGSASGEGGTKKPLVLRINKAASPAASTTTQKTSEVTEKTEKQTEPASVATEASPANGRSDAVSGDSVKVKTFEEIMREKRLRRQQLQEEQASSTSQPEGSAEADSFPKQATGPALQREKRARVSPPAASSPPSITLEAPAQALKTPLRQRITLKPKAASLVSCATASPQQGSPLRQAEADSPSLSPRSSSAAPGKRKRGFLGGSSPPKQAALAAAVASPGPSVKGSPVEKAQDGAQKMCPGQATEAKVRPKLNVRPSVMKLAAQVKPGQKRTSARSAVAAVKPLNSTYAVQEEPLQELPCKRREVSSTSSSVKDQMSSVVSRRPPTILGPGLSSSPLREEFQAVPVNQHSPAITIAAPETCIVPQSPVVNTPIQPKPRRPSVAMSRSTASAPSANCSTSAMDEFDELMNEFTDDRLEDDLELDPGKGEDDYLLELSEMIDS
ncbi:zinc finger CCCH domain-containing protein 11A isoform X2 [Coregonus clupeaformis]|uniref:zinc finger CCCH domain-containing protein 11A isoform X2 n=1 Tax=Coregonus clupeaformis TaxID=59861 RepID=UPI001BDF952D|nr:zinc finger CCCH domain-containing protein 11A isoform X2 [Coregonus clupeaformis]